MAYEILRMTMSLIPPLRAEGLQCMATRHKGPGHWVFCQKGSGHAGRHLWADNLLPRLVRWLYARYDRSVS
jgi:hypothetical protein